MTEQDNYEIAATWNLMTTVPGCFSPVYSYTDEIQWTFNTNNTVDVVIESGTEMSHELHINLGGNYMYNIDNGLITLTNNDIEVSYYYELLSNELILSTPPGGCGESTVITFNMSE